MSETTDIPEGLLYSRDHAWTRVEGSLATIGMTRYAADQMGRLVYLDLPQAGDTVQAGEAAFDVESAKSITPFVSPVTGEVVQVNDDAADGPTIVNADPYGAGWLCKVEVDGAGAGLLDAAAYASFVAGLPENA